jgi:hypothetical protein
MKRFLGPLAVLTLLPLGVVAGGASADPSATGRGGFTVRSSGRTTAHHTGTASVNFMIRGGTMPSGRLTYAAADHMDDMDRKSPYPHVVVRLTEFDSVKFARNTVTIRGMGIWHNEPAMVEAIAIDNGTKGDVFEIRVMRDDKMLYHRRGELEIGDIKVVSE